jgi:hypothetical protein
MQLLVLKLKKYKDKKVKDKKVKKVFKFKFFLLKLKLISITINKPHQQLVIKIIRKICHSLTGIVVLFGGLKRKRSIWDSERSSKTMTDRILSVSKIKKNKAASPTPHPPQPVQLTHRPIKPLHVTASKL